MVQFLMTLSDSKGYDTVQHQINKEKLKNKEKPKIK